MLSQYDLNKKINLGTLIWAETIVNDGKIKLHPAVPEIIGKIREISDDRIFAMITGDVSIRPIYDELFSYGIDTLYHIRNKEMETYHPEAYSEALADISERINPSTIIIAGTSRGREVAPLTAAMLKTGLTADCTKLTVENGRLIMTRPAFSGNILATIISNSLPQMATVRPGTFQKPEPMIGRKGTAISRPFVPSKLKKIIFESTNNNTDNISDAKILISLGNGVKDKEAIAIAEELASKIGASVSCSRALVEKGWFDHTKQVGQSGRNVYPQIYIAFGISGSVQHKAGIHSEKIIAVNNDRNAPIHEISDVSIIGDAVAILKEMNDLIS